jgi:small subunit ribosomal protein S9
MADKEEKKAPAKKETKKKTTRKKTKKEEAPKKEETPMEKPKVEAAPEPKKEAPKKRTKKKKAKKAVKAVVARGKRKECVARATIREGAGIVRFNRMKVSALNNKYVQRINTEPLGYIGADANSIDVLVNVNGGGAMGQAQAARVAIANALVEYFQDKKLRDKFISIDRSLVVEDTRRVETKKFRGPKARARYQKSYR